MHGLRYIHWGKVLSTFAISLAAISAVSAQDLKIGLALPITGAAADTGKRELIGARVAIDQINEKGGINGKKLAFAFADTAGQPQESINAVRKLVGDDKVLAIVGPHYSSEAEATFPLGNRLKVVQIGVASSKPGVSAANRPYGFRNTVSEDKVVEQVAKELARRGIKRVAIITDIKDAVAKSLGTTVYPQVLAKAGIEIINLKDPVTYQTGDAQFATQITKLKSMQPDAVALGSIGPDAISILTEARRQGMTQLFFGTATLLEGNVPEKAGDAANGLLAGSSWSDGIDTPENKAFVQAYREKAKQLYPGAHTETPDFYAVNAYDAVNMLAQSLAAHGTSGDLEKDRTAIMEYLTKLGDFKGLGSKGFDAHGDGLKDILVFEASDRRWRVLQR